MKLSTRSRYCAGLLIYLARYGNQKPDYQSKMKYQRIFNDLHFVLFGLVLFTIMILRGRL